MKRTITLLSALALLATVSMAQAITLYATTLNNHVISFDTASPGTILTNTTIGSNNFVAYDIAMMPNGSLITSVYDPSNSHPGAIVTPSFTNYFDNILVSLHAFDANTLYGIDSSSAPFLWKVDLTSSSATETKITPNQASLYAAGDIANVGGTWYSTYTNSGYTNNNISTIDLATGALSNPQTTNVPLSGLAYDGTTLWGASFLNNILYKVNPSSGDLIESGIIGDDTTGHITGLDYFYTPTHVDPPANGGVPEPGTFAMLGSSLLSLGGIILRRRA